MSSYTSPHPWVTLQGVKEGCGENGGDIVKWERSSGYGTAVFFFSFCDFI